MIVLTPGLPLGPSSPGGASHGHCGGKRVDGSGPDGAGGRKQIRII